MFRQSMVLPFLLVLLYYAFVITVSSIPPEHITIPFQGLPHIDKIYHFTEYGFFGILLARLVYWLHNVRHDERKWNWLFDFFLLVIFFSLLDEFWQSFRERYTDFYDLMVDVIGAAAGAFFYLGLVRYQEKATQKHPEGPSLQFRERLVFACVFMFICAFVFVVLNLLSYKDLFFHARPQMVLTISLVEAACLITVILRFYFLFKRTHKILPPAANAQIN